jgi:hypothetical protein
MISAMAQFTWNHKNIIVMASYSISEHSLQFSTDYKVLSVLDSNAEEVGTYPLDNGDDSVSLTVTSGNYIVNEAVDFDLATHAIDAPANAGVLVTANRIDGIGIMDLRDTNKTGNFHIVYDLECTTFRMKKVGPNTGFWILMGDTGCYTETSI